MLNSHKLKNILGNERGFSLSVEYIALGVVSLIIAAVIYNAVMPGTKNLHNGMVQRVTNITSTGF